MKVLMHYTFGWQKLMDVVYPNLTEYCKKHKYQLALLCVNDYGRYTGEHKIRQIVSEDIVAITGVLKIIDNYTEKV